MNMKNCGHHNVRKHKEIKGIDKYVTLGISSKFDSLDKMKIASSESKEKLERPGKGLITPLGFKAKLRPKKYKKARYAIRNVSKKDLSKIIREFEKFKKLPYEKNRPKHEPTDSYFYLSRQLAKCMMRSNNLNWHDHGGYKEKTVPSLNVIATYEEESKHIIVHEGLSESCSTNERESKHRIANETWSQKNSADVSEYTITEQKDKEYKETSVTKKVTSYFNIFECGRNLLDRLDVTYEQECMDTTKDKYYSMLPNTLVDDNNRKGKPLSNEKLRQAVGEVMEEMEA